MHTQKALSRSDNNYDPTSWQTQSHYSNGDPLLNGSTPLLSQMAVKRRRVGSPSLPTQEMTMSELGANQTFGAAHNMLSTNCSSITNDHSASNNQINRPQIGIRLDDESRWWQWFRTAFLAIQQQACRLIAKEWIKTIHPKKQSTHPYNGNFPRNQQADPQKTRPPYWPSGLLHREPDHIDRDGKFEMIIGQV